MKMYEVLDLQSLYDAIAKTKLPLKTTYKLTRLMKRAELEIEFYQAKFQEILAEYCERDENGQYKTNESGDSVIIMAGKEQECNTKILELRNLDVEINDIKFSIEELESLDISISELACIMSLIED